ncbi:MAG TPA: DUF2490 domain-containing protein [Sphingomonas sp.]|nr:DUF2490 domain-containing protein [Sphingomonas sp.]
MGGHFARSMAALLTLAVAAPAAAEGVQIWSTASLNAPLAGQWRGQVDLSGRTRGGYANGQFVGRLTILHAVAPGLVAGGGYAHNSNYPARGAVTTEGQLFEQLIWDIPAGPIRLAARTRLEQRFQEGVDGTAWRLREQVKLSMPLWHSKMRAVLFAEPFLNLNHTSRVREDFDQLRSFAGLNLPLTRHAALEFGYLGQFRHRLSGNSWIHAVPLTLSVRL